MSRYVPLCSRTQLSNSVIDTGNGISQSKQELIFKDFSIVVDINSQY